MLVHDVSRSSVHLLFAPRVQPIAPAPFAFDERCSFSTQALDGWKPAPLPWLDASEEGDADEDEHLYTACEGLGGVMLEWSVAFLDRLFEVLRHKGTNIHVPLQLSPVLSPQSITRINVYQVLKYIHIWTSCQGMLLLPMSPLKLHRVQWTSS